MMGALVGGSLMIEGYFARLMYQSLYKVHELALHGAPKVALETLARMITTAHRAAGEAALSGIAK